LPAGGAGARGRGVVAQTARNDRTTLTADGAILSMFMYEHAYDDEAASGATGRGAMLPRCACFMISPRKTFGSR
jgi:hypothetical protein